MEPEDGFCKSMGMIAMNRMLIDDQLRRKEKNNHKPLMI